MIDMKKFCAPGTGGRRKCFFNPFVRGGWKYATDGKIIIRIKTDEPESETGIGITKASCEHVIGLVLECPTSAEMWPKSDGKTQSVKCEICKGYGKSGVVECPECDGEGEVECYHCGHDMECEKCFGEGNIVDKNSPVCVSCGGVGQIEIPADQMIKNNVWIGGEYFCKISELPNVRYVPAIEPCLPLRFFFDGGDGVIMPVRK
jgi:hypothetical protein